MPRKSPILFWTAVTLLATFIVGCGSAPTAPDNSREEMEKRRDDTFRELK